MTDKAPSLIAIVVQLFFFFSALAMLAQCIGVFVEYWSNDQLLGQMAIERESGILARGLGRENGVVFVLPAAARALRARRQRLLRARPHRKRNGAVLELRRGMR